MRYVSLFSGIEAATCAWRPLGFQPIFFSEIEPFPCRVLASHFPEIPNLGDVRNIKGEKYRGNVDILVGGTPCQSFSIAGDRSGLDGTSGIIREYFRLLSEIRPTWFVWENVPGCLSSHGGNDFKDILWAWNHCGYHVSWRILDAQFFGVAQRRRRVFAIGHIRDWKRPVKVLFEPESVSRNTQKNEKKKAPSPKSNGEVFGVYSTELNKPSKCLTTSQNRNDPDTQDFAYFDNGSKIRRLTPVECERLQGFTDNYTNIGNVGDAPRYKAIGNSMAVPVMEWIGKRLKQFS